MAALGHFDAPPSIALPRHGAINGHYTLLMGMPLDVRTDGRLRHFLLFQIKHSPLAPKIVRGRGWFGKQDRRRRRQPINAFLANGENLERPFLFVTHYKPPPPPQPPPAADMSLSRSSQNHWRHFWRPPEPTEQGRAEQAHNGQSRYLHRPINQATENAALSPSRLSTRAEVERAVLLGDRRGARKESGRERAKGRAQDQEVREGSERRRRQ